MSEQQYVEYDQYNNQIFCGWLYPDGSRNDCIVLSYDDYMVLQIQFLGARGIEHRFLAECTALLDVLSEGIVGAPMKNLVEEFERRGMVRI